MNKQNRFQRVMSCRVVECIHVVLKVHHAHIHAFTYAPKHLTMYAHMHACMHAYMNMNAVCHAYAYVWLLVVHMCILTVYVLMYACIHETKLKLNRFFH